MHPVVRQRQVLRVPQTRWPVLHFRKASSCLLGQLRRFPLVSTHHPDSTLRSEFIPLHPAQLLQPLVHRMDQGTIPSWHPCRSPECCCSSAAELQPRSCESSAAVTETTRRLLSTSILRTPSPAGPLRGTRPTYERLWPATSWPSKAVRHVCSPGRAACP